MASNTTKLAVSSRKESGSRAARRLRRLGVVPGVVYGQSLESTPIKAPAHELRHALAATGAVIELKVDAKGESRPVVVKDVQHNPVRGDLTHIDFLQVRLDEAITASVAVELINVETAPGVKEGGVLEQVTRELSVQALPTAIPDRIVIDVSELQVAETMTLSDVQVPAGVTLLDDPNETVIATITAATELEQAGEVEEEIGLVGEEAAEVTEGKAGEGGAGDESGGKEKPGGESN